MLLVTHTTTHGDIQALPRYTALQPSDEKWESREGRDMGDSLIGMGHMGLAILRFKSLVGTTGSWLSATDRLEK